MKNPPPRVCRRSPIRKAVTAALVALTGLAASATAALVPANFNDLILGFRATGGQGQNVNLEVNLGSVTQFTGLPAGTVLAVSGLSATDLAAAYGSSWNTRTDLVWGIVGATGRTAGGPSGQPAGTIWATAVQPAVGTQSAPWTPGSSASQGAASARVEQVLFGAPGSLNGRTDTGNSTTSSLAPATAAGSYTAQAVGQSGPSFGLFSPGVDNSAAVPAGSFAVSDLYELRVGDAAARYVGSFGLTPDGVLLFATSPSYFGSAAAANAPVPTVVPTSQAIDFGANTTFRFSANGTGMTFTWFKDGNQLPNTLVVPGVGIQVATTATSRTNTTTVTNGSAVQAGVYWIQATNSAGTVTTTRFTLTLPGVALTPGRITNLSARTFLAAGDVCVVGLVVGGSGTSGAKAMLMRAIGPSLGAGWIADPKMAYYNGTTQIGANDNWGGDPDIAAAVRATGAAGLPFASPASLDAAIWSPNVPAGNNTIVVSGAPGTSGNVIAELYDATPLASFTPATTRLVNASISANIGSGGTATIAGFAINGTTNRNILIRGIGPGLAQFGVTGIIADPKMTLFSGTSVALASNDNWGTPVGASAATAAQLSATFAAVGAFPLPAGSADAALLVNLAPGNYTVQVAPATGATGVGLIEIYEAP